MKFFIDTGNVEEIREAASLGILDGVTTNPSLVAKDGRAFHDVLRDIVSIVNGPISAEVTSTDHEKMLEQGRELAGIHPNIVIKVPLTKTGLQTCRRLRQENIHVNVTLCFFTKDGLKMSSLSTLNGDLLADVREGAVRCRVRIPDCNLNPGTYVLVMPIHEGKSYLYRDVVKEFVVTGRGGMNWDLVDFRYEYSVDEPEKHRGQQAFL